MVLSSWKTSRRVPAVRPSRREVVVEVRLDRVRGGVQAFTSGHDLIQLIGADERVDFGQVLLDIAAVSLHQAPGSD